MEDKTFEILTKIHGEFIEFRKDMNEFRRDMIGFKGEMIGFKGEMIGFKEDMTEFKENMTGFTEDINEFKEDMTGFTGVMLGFRKESDSRLGKIESILEHDIKANLQSLHESSFGNTALLQEHSERLNAIDNKLDYLALSLNSQDKRLEVVEASGKRKAK